MYRPYLRAGLGIKQKGRGRCARGLFLLWRTLRSSVDAEAQDEDEAVAHACEDHYKPKGPDDLVPADPVSVAVALAVVTTSCSGGSAAPRASPSTLDTPTVDLDRTVEVNGVKIHAVCSGEGGAATVVLLPGFGEATSSMDPVRDSVDSFARV
mgnify:CR=1 FL=1